MRLTSDLHTHTFNSDGEGSVEDNVSAAISRGLTTIGITDHSIAHVLYGVKKRHLAQYVLDVKAMRKRYVDHIEVKTGVELNLIGLDGSVDMPDGYDFDVLIMGYHKAALCKNISTAWRFSLGERLGKTARQRITDAYKLAIQRHPINIVAHPGYGVPIDYRQVAQACADYGALFEINERHADLTVENLHEAAQTGVQFVISSDAHTPDAVGNVPGAMALAERAGLGSDRIVNVAEE